MDAINVLIEMLKEKNIITPLEQDILDTYHEVSKKTFDRDSAIRQAQKNNLNHPDIFAAISMNPTTVFKPWAVALDEDVCSNLTSQLGAFAEREWGGLQGGK